MSIIKGTEFLLEMEPSLKYQPGVVIPNAMVFDSMPTLETFRKDLFLLPKIMYDNPSEGASLFKEAWQYSSTFLIELYGQQNILKIFEFFGSIFFMDDNESEFFMDLPKEIQVYHGGKRSIEDAINSISWTLHSGFAEPYAGGALYEGFIDKKHVIAFFSSESEVIIRPGKVSLVKEINNPRLNPPRQ